MLTDCEGALRVGVWTVETAGKSPRTHHQPRVILTKFRVTYHSPGHPNLDEPLCGFDYVGMRPERDPHDPLNEGRGPRPVIKR